MPFIPHTDADVKAMLKSIGVNSIDDLFDEIPEKLRAGKLTQVPEGLSEMDIGRLMQTRANQDGAYINFIGAGAYEHHIPAAVWEIVSRGEFYSAYTPYQAEASQGTLQLLYEYQTMMASLTGMDVSNASLYDGASGLAEAVLMAVRAHTRTPGTGKKTARKILMPSTVHPIYHRVVHAIVANQNIELVEIPHCTEGGHTIPESLRQYEGGEFAALVIRSDLPSGRARHRREPEHRTRRDSTLHRRRAHHSGIAQAIRRRRVCRPRDPAAQFLRRAGRGGRAHRLGARA